MSAAIETLLVLCGVSAAAAVLRARISDKPREPVEGQAGRDAVWVPTPPALVERMLDIARVTPADYVIDLGSGDGRNVIAAAGRGARALGVEYDAGLIAVSRRNAVRERVAHLATFVQADLYEADISGATVLMLFLQPENLRELSAKFMALKPGTRIVTNRFGIEGREPDEISRIGGDSPSCCTALLYVVPEKAGITPGIQAEKAL
jgi:SAM-dependent methyltransferase